MNCFSMFDHFLGLALKGLKLKNLESLLETGSKHIIDTFLPTVYILHNLNSG